MAELDELDIEVIRGLADNRMIVTRTAKAMFVHCNTLRYRGSNE